MNNPIKPDHYKTGGGVECIDAIAEATKNLNGTEAFCTGNAMKYLWRWKKKNKKSKGRIEDLMKAKEYIDMLLNYLNRKVVENSENYTHIDCSDVIAPHIP